VSRFTNKTPLNFLLMKKNNQTLRLSLAALLLLVCGNLPAEEIVFPPNADIVDVVRDYKIDNTGKTDVYPQLQKIFDECSGKFRVIYFPKGTYLIGGSLHMRIARERGPLKEGNHGPVMIGESREETIIKLKDGIWTKPDRELPPPDSAQGKDMKPYKLIDTQVVVHTGDSTNTTFGKVIRNFTVNTGKNNPAAIGVMFCTSNYGQMMDINIVSEDGKGMCGLAMAGAESGPGQVSDVSIKGFATGIYSATEYSFAISHVTMEAIGKVAIYNLGKSACENFSIKMGPTNSPAITNRGLLTMVGLNLEGKSSQPAILNSAKGIIYLRDVKTTGFAGAIANGQATVGEFAAGAPVAGLFQDKKTSLKLPIKIAPRVPFEKDMAKWANPLDYGAKGDGVTDDTESVQKALNDPKKTHVIFPRSYWNNKTAVNQFKVTKTLVVPPNIERIIGTGGIIRADDYAVKLKVANGKSPLSIEMMRSLPTLEFESNRTLIVNCSRFGLKLEDAEQRRNIDKFPVVLKGTGDVFMNDVPTPLLVDNPGQNVWLRHHNNESGAQQKAGELHVKAGTAWVLGWKSENLRQRVIVDEGGKLEVICFDNFSWTPKGRKKDGDWPMFRVNNGDFALCGLLQHGNESNQNIVWETRDGVTKKLTKENNGSLNVSLYTGF
jgi:hypothetical protein